MFLSLLLLGMPAARAETVSAVGGVSVEGRITELDAGGRLVVEPARGAGEPRRVPLAEVVEIRYDRPAADSLAQTESPRTVHFENGDSLQGDVLAMEGERLVMTAPHLGRLSAPIEAVRGFWHPRQGVAAAAAARAREALLSAEPAAEDVLFLANGDAARGAIGKLAGGRVEMEHLALKKQVVVDLHDVIALRFARVGGAKARAPEGVTAVLELRGGSRLSGRLAAADTEKLSIEWLGGARLAVPLRDLVRVSFRGGRLAWLSDLPPAAREEKPLLGPAFKLGLDRTATGRPLRIGGQEFRRGLSTRVSSRYTWKLSGEWAAFESHLGVDDEAGADGDGRVRFRVLVDGKEKFDSGPVRGGEAPRYARVDISGARELTLCVEEAGELDLAGLADWAEAHLIKPPAKGTEETK